VSADPVGWFATAILILTMGRQTYTQWREKTSAGVSRWLFIGQIAASVAFVIYSALLGNIVFVVSNCFLIVIAITGQCLYRANAKCGRA
jgi:uncharacterized protein with PQ loop repeat